MFILKIIGVAILAVILLLLAALAIIMFSPFKYEAKAQSGEKTQAGFDVRWLFFRAKAQSGEGLSAYIFGKNIFENAPQKQEDAKQETIKQKTQKQTSHKDLPDKEKINSDKKIEEEKLKQERLKQEKLKQEKSNKEKLKQEKPDKKRLDKEKLKRDDELVAAERQPKESRRKKAKNERIKRKIKEYIEEVGVSEFIKPFIKLFKDVIKCVRPKKLSVDGKFSLSDPSYTAYALAALGFVDYKTGGVNVEGDFESDKIYAEGKASVKGKIRLAKIVGKAIVFLTSKHIREIITIYQREK